MWRMAMRNVKKLCALPCFLIFSMIFVLVQSSSGKMKEELSIAEKQSGWQVISLDVNGVKRWSRVYAPKSLPKNAPVVLLLHGGTQSMRKVFQPNAGGTLEWPILAEKEGFLLLTPNGTHAKTGNTFTDKQGWNDVRPSPTYGKPEADDVAFMKSLLDWAQQKYAIDPQRVYATGSSNGGLMTYRLLLEIPDRIAAGVAFIANFPSESPFLNTSSEPRPVMIVNGTQDPLVPWEGGSIEGGRGNILSALETRTWWVKHNRANLENAQETKIAEGSPKDNCKLYETTYPPLSGGAPVVFIKMDGGGHSMPSIAHLLPNNLIVRRIFGPSCQASEGAVLAWKFLKDFRL